MNNPITKAFIKSAQFSTYLDMMFAAKMPVKIEAGPGMGKTEMTTQFAEAKGPDYGFFEMNVALASEPDVQGFLLPRQETALDANGNEISLLTGHYTMPYFMRDMRTGRPSVSYKRGLLVLEEWGQGQSPVKRMLAPAIHDKRLGAHFFPEQCDVIILTNRPEDRSGVSKEFDFLINRWAEAQLIPSPEGWIVHASEIGAQSETIAFANRNRNMVFNGNVPKEQGPWMTPRSLMGADRILASAKEMNLSLDDDMVMAGLIGTIGMAGATQFLAFAKLRDHLPKFSDIVRDPEGTRLPVDNDGTLHYDQLMFLSFDLASRTEKSNVEKIVTYINRFPIDMAVAYYRAAVRRDKSLISTRSFGDWMTKNVKLLAAVS